MLGCFFHSSDAWVKKLKNSRAACQGVSVHAIFIMPLCCKKKPELDFSKSGDYRRTKDSWTDGSWKPKNHAERFEPSPGKQPTWWLKQTQEIGEKGHPDYNPDDKKEYELWEKSLKAQPPCTVTDHLSEPPHACVA